MNNKHYIAPISLLENIFFRKKELWNILSNTIHKKQLGFKSHKWDESIFIPSHIWVNLINNELNSAISNRFTLDLTVNSNQTALLATLMSITSWRFSQGCYQLHEELSPLFFKKTDGSKVSVKHFHNLNEWTACIPLNNQSIGKHEVYCFYAHKNYILNQGSQTPCLILTFHTSKETNVIPLPYVILNYSRNSEIRDALIGFGGLGLDSNEDVAEFLAPYISIFNAIFDSNTKIESDIVGVKKPHYKDVEMNINFNDLNIPTIKHLAPSNIRLWNAGTNHCASLKKLNRQNPNITHKLYWNNEGELELSVD